MVISKQQSVFECKSVSQENAGEALSVDSKARISQAGVLEHHYAENQRLRGSGIDVNELDDKTPTDILESVRNAPMDIVEPNPIEPNNQYIASLEEQHCKDTETITQLQSDIECLQKRLKGAMRRCDENRSETLHEQNKRREDAAEAESKYHALLIESERRIEKLERQHEIEVKNLKHEIKLQDKALEKHVEDDKLIALLMKKGASYAERMISE